MELKTNIRNEISAISDQILQNVMQKVVSQLEERIEENGGYLQHIISKDSELPSFQFKNTCSFVLLIVNKVS